MSKLPPTAEQLAIVEQAVNSKQNLLVEARAGAAKTTTLIMIAEAMTKKHILCLAFNKKIKEEMTERMPGNVTASTLHSLGYSAWRQYVGGRTRTYFKKNYDLVTEEIKALTDKDEIEEAWANFSDLMKAVGESKNAGVLFGNTSPGYRPLCSEDTFFDEVLDWDASPLERQIIRNAAKRSWDQVLDGVLDFDDMLLAPAVAGVSFDVYDVVMVDEAQDLSPINHVLLKKVVRKRTKLIAVGDPCQAIYGFRGADEGSMQTLKQMFDMECLYLTTCFRCSQAVIENAKWRAPDMNWWPDSLPGLILRPLSWKINDIPDGAAVLCRNNAPLFSLAIMLIRAGRYPDLGGRDIVKTLLSKMKKLGKPQDSTEQILLQLDDWQEKEEKRVKSKRLVADTRACMEVFLTEAKTLKEAMELAAQIAERPGRIQLMTGHKAKGLEFETVFILEQKLLTREGQDPNIRYVMETRSKDKLVYIQFDDLEEGED